MATSRTARDIQPITKFARAFKHYNVGLSLIVATVPVVVGIWDVIPLYANTKNFLTLVTSVGSYLLVGFLFSRRTEIARLYFPARGKTRAAYSKDVRLSQLFGFIPIGLLVLTLAFFYLYNFTLNQSIENIAYKYAVKPGASTDGQLPPQVCDELALKVGESKAVVGELVAFAGGSRVKIYCELRGRENKSPVQDFSVSFPDESVVKKILALAPSTSVPYSILMSIWFLAAFLCATSAFILMGLREYIQEELGLNDEDLITPVRATVERRFPLDGVPTLFGKVEFSPVDPGLTPIIRGPFCIWHEATPKPREADAQGRVTKWVHTFKVNDKLQELECPLQAQLSETELEKRLDQGANQLVADVRKQGAVPQGSQ
jgi:hypothetical protein